MVDRECKAQQKYFEECSTREEDSEDTLNALIDEWIGVRKEKEGTEIDVNSLSRDVKKALKSRDNLLFQRKSKDLSDDSLVGSASDSEPLQSDNESVKILKDPQQPASAPPESPPKPKKERRDPPISSAKPALKRQRPRADRTDKLVNAITDGIDKLNKLAQAVIQPITAELDNQTEERLSKLETWMDSIDSKLSAMAIQGKDLQKKGSEGGIFNGVH